MLSARLGDVLSNLYLASMVIKQWHEGDRVESEAALFHYAATFLLGAPSRPWTSCSTTCPTGPLARVLRPVVMPRGKRFKRPHDDLARSIAQAVSRDSALREKLLRETWQTDDGVEENPLAHYNALLATQERAEGALPHGQQGLRQGGDPGGGPASGAAGGGSGQGRHHQRRGCRLYARAGGPGAGAAQRGRLRIRRFVTDKSKVLRHHAA
jgi:acyl-CoA dehydrogenase